MQEFTQADIIAITDSMKRYGGNFIKKLADAIIAADPENRKTLLDAFPDEISKYHALIFYGSKF